MGVGADDHRGVADGLDQAHVAAQALGGELDQAVGDPAELVGRDLLAQAGEADEVGEADRHIARPRQRARLALGRVDGLGAHGLAQVQAGHVLEHGADHRHEAGDALGVAARQLGLAQARLEDELEGRRAQRLGRLRHPAPDDADDRELLLLADPRLQEGARDPRGLDIGVRADHGVHVGHGHALRAAQGHEEVGAIPTRSPTSRVE